MLTKHDTLHCLKFNDCSVVLARITELFEVLGLQCGTSMIHSMVSNLRISVLNEHEPQHSLKFEDWSVVKECITSVFEI